MTVEKALFTLRDMLDEKARTRALEALGEVTAHIADGDHRDSEIREALGELSAYDSTFTDISIAEGIRRMRMHMLELTKEQQLLRSLYDRSDGVITAAKVALVESITADHRWHTAEENCPHVRCIALNKIEELRG